MNVAGWRWLERLKIFARDPVSPMRCAVTGHDDRQKLGDDAVWLQCFRCDRRTKGWTVQPRRQSGPVVSVPSARN